MLSLLPQPIIALFLCCWLPRVRVLALKSTIHPPKIAVIGGGASGLAAARVLSRNGMEPIVLEQNTNSGGVWKYQEGSKTSPMYGGLRSNLPKEIMAYREFPWPRLSDDPQSDPSFLTHAQVLGYLQSYQNKFDLEQFIHFGCHVTRLKLLEDTVSSFSPPTEVWPQMELEWEDCSGDESTSIIQKSDIFDAVLCCNGHYAKPAFAEIPGLKERFKGTTMHSIEYDNPTDFQGQRVLCVGGRASGEDLAREISMHASRVFLSSSTYPQGQAPKSQGKVTLVPRTKEVVQDGSILFDGYSETSQFDVIVYCTGYDYDFPFIHDSDNLVQFISGERRVKPLYEQVFHARHPNLSFLGLPHSVLPFPMFEFQAEAIAAQFSSCNLPDQKERLEQAAQDASSGGPNDGGRVQDTHYLGNCQWGYMRRLATLAGTSGDEIEHYMETTKMIWDRAGAERKGSFPGGPDVYREILYQRDDKNRSFSIRNDAHVTK